MQDEDFNNSERDNPYEINDGRDEEQITAPAQPEQEVSNAETSATENAEVQGETDTAEPHENNKNEEASSISSDLIRGHINTIILRALYERDKYGYEIMNDIEQKSHGQYALKQPTLYSALKRLETQGYIKAYWKTDEVSSGGRRKYFTLTESGKEITEKNLAEWEYSRTIIDSLISDRSFDFSQPAPTPVDFTILRNSVSRVPVVRSDEADRAAQTSGEGAATVNNAENANNAANTAPQATQQPSTAESQPIAAPTPAPTTQHPTASQAAPQEQTIIGEGAEQQAFEQPAQPKPEAIEPSPAPAPTPTQSEREIASQAEARRLAHENYMRLISEPVRTPEPVRENIVPNSENVNTERLIYNNKPETERDYKNLIDSIFKRAVTNGTVQTTFAPPPPPAPQPRIRLVDRGRADGVMVASSNGYDASATYATKTTYNKGVTLLKCAAIVLAICALEFVCSFIFLKQLNTTWIYPTVILLLGLIQFSVFGIMALRGYGKNCVRPTTNSYISSCVILTIIAILIISASSFLLNINPTSVSDVMKMLVIPSITALNITIFSICFKAFLK